MGVVGVATATGGSVATGASVGALATERSGEKLCERNCRTSYPVQFSGALLLTEYMVQHVDTELFNLQLHL